MENAGKRRQTRKSRQRGLRNYDARCSGNSLPCFHSCTDITFDLQAFAKLNLGVGTASRLVFLLFY
jgi:hypothetical protein